MQPGNLQPWWQPGIRFGKNHCGFLYKTPWNGGETLRKTGAGFLNHQMWFMWLFFDSVLRHLEFQLLWGLQFCKMELFDFTSEFDVFKANRNRNDNSLIWSRWFCTKNCRLNWGEVRDECRKHEEVRFRKRWWVWGRPAMNHHESREEFRMENSYGDHSPASWQ